MSRSRAAMAILKGKVVVKTASMSIVRPKTRNLLIQLLVVRTHRLKSHEGSEWFSSHNTTSVAAMGVRTLFQDNDQPGRFCVHTLSMASFLAMKHHFDDDSVASCPDADWVSRSIQETLIAYLLGMSEYYILSSDRPTLRH